MDISKEVEIILRDAGYNTWPWENRLAPVVCFESEAVLGFIFFFKSPDDLLKDWELTQKEALTNFRVALKKAGEKAWNIYSVFLTELAPTDVQKEDLNRIEENFQMTRKIVRAGVQSKNILISTLLPLLPIRNTPRIDESNFENRLISALSEIHPEGCRAFMGNAKPFDVAQILADL